MAHAAAIAESPNIYSGSTPIRDFEIGSSLTSSRPNSEDAARPDGEARVVPFPLPAWSTPTLTEVTGADRHELLKILAQIPVAITAHQRQCQRPSARCC